MYLWSRWSRDHCLPPACEGSRRRRPQKVPMRGPSRMRVYTRLNLPRSNKYVIFGPCLKLNSLVDCLKQKNRRVNAKKAYCSSSVRKYGTLHRKPRCRKRGTIRVCGDTTWRGHKGWRWKQVSLAEIACKMYKEKICLSFIWRFQP